MPVSHTNYIRIQQTLSNQGEILSHSEHTRARSLNPTKMAEWEACEGSIPARLSPLHNVIHFSPVRTGLHHYLWRKPETDSLIGGRMTACYTLLSSLRCCLIWLVQKGVHFPTISGGLLCSMTIMANNLPSFIPPQCGHGAAVPPDCSRSRKKKKKTLSSSVTLESLQTTNPGSLWPFVDTLLRNTSPDHTLHPLSYGAPMA